VSRSVFFDGFQAQLEGNIGSTNESRPVIDYSLLLLFIEMFFLFLSI